MERIVESIEIARPPEDVFSYATDFSHFPEWQAGVAWVRRKSDAPLGVGSRAAVTGKPALGSCRGRRRSRSSILRGGG
jgi:uncharacterized protein YndB with AHSA1/START domain